MAKTNPVVWVVGIPVAPLETTPSVEFHDTRRANVDPPRLHTKGPTAAPTNRHLESTRGYPKYPRVKPLSLRSGPTSKTTVEVEAVEYPKTSIAVTSPVDLPNTWCVDIPPVGGNLRVWWSPSVRETPPYGRYIGTDK